VQLGHSVLFGQGLCDPSSILTSKQACSWPCSSASRGIAFSLVTGVIAVRLSEAYFVIVTAIFSAIFHLLAVDLTWLTGGDDD